MKKLIPLLLILFVGCNETKTTVPQKEDTIVCCESDTMFSDKGEPLMVQSLIVRYPNFTNTMVGDTFKLYRSLLNASATNYSNILSKYNAQLIVNGVLIIDSIYQKKQIDSLRDFNNLQLSFNRSVVNDTTSKSKSISDLKDSALRHYVWIGNVNTAGYKYRYSDSIDNVKTNKRLDSTVYLSLKDYTYDSLSKTYFIKK